MGKGAGSCDDRPSLALETADPVLAALTSTDDIIEEPMLAPIDLNANQQMMLHILGNMTSEDQEWIPCWTLAHAVTNFGYQRADGKGVSADTVARFLAPLKKHGLADRKVMKNTTHIYGKTAPHWRLTETGKQYAQLA